METLKAVHAATSGKVACITNCPPLITKIILRRARLDDLFGNRVVCGGNTEWVPRKWAAAQHAKNGAKAKAAADADDKKQSSAAEAKQGVTEDGRGGGSGGSSSSSSNSGSGVAGGGGGAQLEGDDDEVGYFLHAKPSSDIIDFALFRFFNGLPASAACVVGDSKYDIMAANAAGCAHVAVHHQCLGARVYVPSLDLLPAALLLSTAADQAVVSVDTSAAAAAAVAPSLS